MQAEAWSCKVEVDWTELPDSIRTLLVAEVLLVRPRPADVPEELYQISSGLLVDLARTFKGGMILRLKLHRTPARILELQRIEEEKADMLRAGASTEMMRYFFRLSKRQVQRMRKHLGIMRELRGRPAKLTGEKAYEIIARWAELKDQGLSPLLRLRHLKETHAEYGMATIFALVRKIAD